MLSAIDQLSEWSGRFAAWMFFAIGVMVSYEVVSRNLFIAPTVWAEEVSQFFQIWATYLAAGYIVKHRQLIVIEFFIIRLSPTPRLLADIFALSIMAIFSFVAVFYGIDIVLESIQQGRNTSTILGVPKWMTESAIPLGFSILLLQILAQFIRLFTDPEPPTTHSPLDEI